MGFGSGGGGFTPSPNVVPGSTQTGTDKDTDVHQFTGSVDITGSLTLNGSAITGGGGGGGSPGGSNSQVQYNDGGSFGGASALVYDDVNNRVGIGIGTPTAALHVSSSTSDPLFRVDHSTQAGSQPILYVTGSGLVAIGTDSPRTDTGDTNRLHILGESGGDQGVDPAVNSVLVLENNDHAGLNIITPADKSGMLVFGDPGASNRAYFRYAHGTSGGGPIDRFIFDGTFSDSVMTIRRDGDSINIGQNDADHMLTNKAALHISSSTGGTDVGGPVLLRVDHADQPGAQPTLFATGSGRVGVGTSTPSYELHVSGSDSSGSIAAGVAFMGYSDDSTKAPGDATWAHIDHTRDNGAIGQMDFALQQKSNGSTIVNSPTGGNVSLRIGGYVGLQLDSNSNVGINTQPTARLHINAIGSGATRESDLLRIDGDSNHVMFVTGSGRVGINTGTPVQELSVSGSAAFSGAFGSTAIETLTANGTISANTGLTLIDASSSLAVNNTLLFSIANGTFAGQEKKIRGLIISGSDGANSTGIYITGANIDSPPFLGGSGQIVLSSSNPSSGPSFQRAGCSLIWDGSKWLPVGNYNFNINTTGF